MPIEGEKVWEFFLPHKNLEYLSKSSLHGQNWFYGKNLKATVKFETLRTHPKSRSLKASNIRKPCWFEDFFSIFFSTFLKLITTLLCTLNVTSYQVVSCEVKTVFIVVYHDMGKFPHIVDFIVNPSPPSLSNFRLKMGSRLMVLFWVHPKKLHRKEGAALACYNFFHWELS